MPPVIRITPRWEERIDTAVRTAIERSQVPGAVVVLGRADGIVFRRAYGARAVKPERETMTETTVFDLASLTKPVVTATLIHLLAEEGTLELDAPVARYLPSFAANGKARVTVADLLAHRSGLPPANPLSEYESGPDAAIAAILRSPLRSRPRSRVLYSDLGYVVLGVLAERVTGKALDELASERIFTPLAMSSSGFLPGAHLRDRVAPTTQRDGVFIRGEPHDPRAHRLGGVAGHAGLFSTADDLARYARMLLREGTLDGPRILDPSTVRRMTEPVADHRSLAFRFHENPRTWREPLSDVAYGHGGFTGTALWIDPKDDLFLIVLSHRVHPDGGGTVHPLVRSLRGLAVRAVRSARPPPAPGRRVLTGIDVLRRDRYAQLAGSQVALLTNDSGRARDGQPTARLLARAPDVTLVRLLTPEHGLDARHEGAVADSVDEASGVPVQSLFGRRRRPSTRALEGIDAVVVDLQDVGVRFYTYASTVRAVLEEAAARDVDVVVLDRPNPLGGARVEGPVLDDDIRSFVNHFSLPVRHGMTLGELARLFATELDLDVRLRVVPVEGWTRSMLFDETGLRWVSPSPNLPSLEAVLLYPALGLLEGTNVSVGRGTDRPFGLLGAPWLRGPRLLDRLEAGSVAGLRLEPTRFSPGARPYRGRPCRGLALRVEHRDRFEPVRAGLALAQALAGSHPRRWDPAGLLPLVGDREVVEQLLGGAPLDDVVAGWEAELRAFRSRRARHLLYPGGE